MTHSDAQTLHHDPSPQVPPRRSGLIALASLVGLPSFLPAWSLLLESATNECTADPPGQVGQWDEVIYDRSRWPLFITCVIDPGTSRERRVSVPWESRRDAANLSWLIHLRMEQPQAPHE